MMNKDKFWAIIENVNSKVKEENRVLILEETKKELMKLGKKEIMHWKIIMEEYMDIADRHDIWEACANTGSHCTDDGFMDFRAWLISKGKETYMNVIKNPSSLENIEYPVGEANFEEYLYIAPMAYDAKYSTENKIANLYVDMQKEKISKEVYEEIISEVNLKEDMSINIKKTNCEEVTDKSTEKCSDINSNFNMNY